MDEIRRNVKVIRGRTPQQLVDEVERSGRLIIVDPTLVPTIPHDSDEEEVTLVYFNPGKYLSDVERDEELVRRGLVRDTHAQFQDNIDDPSFADTHPNATSWPDTSWPGVNNNYCYVLFIAGNGKRVLRIVRGTLGMPGGIWIVGALPK